MVVERTPLTFESEGVLCAATLFAPASPPAQRPCVVMANGFSGTMDWILPSFAERFAAAGLAVLAFDYRHLGRSDGEPRQLVDVRKQRADLRAAVACARRQPGIRPERVALWGTSLGGSHVVEVAAEDARIAAVILNMPALDALAGANVEAKRERAGVSRATVAWVTARLLAAAARDAARGALGRPPRYLAVYGAPGEAFFTDPELAPRFERVAEESPTWQNRVAARFLLRVPRYREGTMERIAAPILVCLAERDVEVSAAFVRSKAERARRAEIRTYPADHFDLYHGDAFEQVAADQTEFLRAHLAP
ncbi:alpha/beta hydrolase [Sorangium cellulosum]|uniref:Alpha/beta hydrolase n=1 Tax=Sorangium cellulosum TaxID=56 RepID=A0A2L0F0T9_SORCE|nr:alpha/beta fold hydrolase [Sorangium cellulosum]AUX45184.1 alpha/beta hydrolase [Sorangium cellulosum]